VVTGQSALRRSGYRFAAGKEGQAAVAGPWNYVPSGPRAIANFSESRNDAGLKRWS
jgi:hypothetical protein